MATSRTKRAKATATLLCHSLLLALLPKHLQMLSHYLMLRLLCVSG
jgi:hypothetical protein